MNTIYQLKPQEHEIKTALQIVHCPSVRCMLKPSDGHAVKLFKTRRGCITPSMAFMFGLCSRNDCDGCPVVDRAILPGGLLHQPVRSIEEITRRLYSAEMELVEIKGKLGKADRERIDSALSIIRDSLDHLKKHTKEGIE